jgi:hypothetical protein
MTRVRCGHQFAKVVGITYDKRAYRMLKIFLLLTLFLTTTVSMASPIDPMMTIKERLRLSLWVEGLNENPQQDSMVKAKRDLPEEIERALKKL